MQLKILCPVSNKAITNPVIFHGYIYEKSSLEWLIDKDQIQLSKQNLITDYFTQSLLDFVNTNKNIKLDLDALEEIYKCPITHAYPNKGVLCLGDGRTYEEDYILKHYDMFANAPYNRQPASVNDLIYHPIHLQISNMLNNDDKKEIKTIDVINFFENFKQSDPQLIRHEGFLLPDKYKRHLEAFALCTSMYSTALWINYLRSLSTNTPYFIMVSFFSFLNIYHEQKSFRKTLHEFVFAIYSGNIYQYYISSKNTNGERNRLSFSKISLLMLAVPFLLQANLKISLNFFHFYVETLNLSKEFEWADIYSYINPTLLLGWTLTRSLMEFHAISIILRSNYLAEQATRFFNKRLDGNAQSNRSKSVSKVKFEAVGPLVAYAIFMLTALYSFYMLNKNGFENEFLFLVPILIAKFPFFLLTATKVLEQLSTVFFSQENIESKNQQCSNMSLMFRSTSAVTNDLFTSSKERLYSVGTGFRAFVETSFENCINDFNKQYSPIGFFSKLKPIKELQEKKLFNAIDTSKHYHTHKY